MAQRSLRRLLLTLLACLLVAASLAPGAQAAGPPRYPRLAARYWSGAVIRWEDVPTLARYHLLVADLEAQHVSAAQLREIRARNPDIVILASVIPTGQWVDSSAPPFVLRRHLTDPALGYTDRWVVRDPSGKPVTHWGGQMYLMNVSSVAPLHNGRRWSEHLAEFVQREVMGSGLWDGVYYDTLPETIAWMNGGNLDLDGDGRRDDPTWANKRWKEGVTRLVSYTRALLGPGAVVVANSHNTQYAWANGRWFEGFPAIDGANPDEALAAYLTWRQTHYGRDASVINHAGDARDLRAVRFGLAAALMGDGFFISDDEYPVNNLRWYDEYDADLGQPLGGPYRVGARTLADTDFEDGATGPWVAESGAVTADPARVVNGGRSLYVSNFNEGSVWHPLFRLDSSRVPLKPSATYTLELTYRVVSTPYTQRHDDMAYFYVYAVRGNWADPRPSRAIMDAQGTRGRLVYTFTTGPHADYTLRFMSHYQGAIAVDDVHLMEGDGSGWRRDFANGTVLLNTSSRAVTFELGGSYRRLSGAQDPAVNSGRHVSSVTLGPREGLLLLRASAFAALSAPAPIVLDNRNAQLQGAWPASTVTSGYWGPDYQYRPPGNGSGKVVWVTRIPASGRYRVLARWTAGWDRAPDATYGIGADSKGLGTVRVDQRTSGGQWVELGTFSFQAGQWAWVDLSDRASGVVVADAVQLVPVS